MSKFIKLTNMLLNTNYINKIYINPNQYVIYLTSNKFDGTSWSITGSGLGLISSLKDIEIEVCETKHSTDYKIVSNWINKI